MQELDGPLPGLERLAELAASDSEAISHAAILHVCTRARSSGSSDWLPSVLPMQRLLALAPESQMLVAELVLSGHLRDLPRASQSDLKRLPPLVTLAWLRAQMILHPELALLWEGTQLCAQAARDLPCDLAVLSGLIPRLVASTDPELRLVSVGYLQAAVEAGLLAPIEAQKAVMPLMADERAPVAIAAMRLLQQTWAHGLELPELVLRTDDLEWCLEAIALLEARGELRRLRNPSERSSHPSLRQTYARH
jgi:hypothetical protein